MSSVLTPPAPSVAVGRVQEIEACLRLLHAPGSVFEVRALGVDRRGFARTASGYYDDFGKAARDVLMADAWASGVYVTLNPVAPALLARAANRVVERPKHTTADDDIIRRRWLLFDVDPQRPAGIAATDAEVQAAQALADAVKSLLAERGWPAPLRASSGNGVYLAFRIDLQNDAESAEIVRSIYSAVQAMVPSDTARIDLAVFNAARIIRVGGTTNRKGDPLPDRPHRRCRWHDPGQPVEVVGVDLLRSMAALAPRPAPATPSTPHTSLKPAGAWSVADRVRAYLAACPPAIAGQGGHDTTYAVANALVRGFALPPGEAISLMGEWNARCVPPWSDAELRHKLADADRQEGPRGYLRDGGQERAVPPSAQAGGEPEGQEAIVERLRECLPGFQRVVQHGKSDASYQVFLNAGSFTVPSSETLASLAKFSARMGEACRGLRPSRVSQRPSKRSEDLPWSVVASWLQAVAEIVEAPSVVDLLEEAIPRFASESNSMNSARFYLAKDVAEGRAIERDENGEVVRDEFPEHSALDTGFFRGCDKHDYLRVGLLSEWLSKNHMRIESGRLSAALNQLGWTVWRCAKARFFRKRREPANDDAV